MPDITVLDNENQIYNVIEKKKQKDIQKMRDICYQ